MLEILETWVSQASEGNVRTFNIHMDSGNTKPNIWVFDSETQCGVTFTMNEIDDNWLASPKWSTTYQEQLAYAQEQVSLLQTKLGAI